MKYLLILILLLPMFCSAQLVFEVNAPTEEKGVFPCMAPNPSEWLNSSNLYQDGNWFSDTLVLADDGILASACSPLVNSINSNFVLFQRTGCNLGQSLLNAQNAGATGAIVIDSVDGRPLPFEPDALGDSISIPFVVISLGKGDSLKQRLIENEIVVVSFGDKTGTNTTDIGIYKEFSLWSRYGIFPFGYYQLPDTLFGTWVYNHGTTDVDSLQVKLWFYHDINYPQHNQSILSAPFDLAAGDSVLINFNYEYPVQYAVSIVESNPLSYGYEVIGLADDDTLDNRINMIIYSEDKLVSNTFSASIFNTYFSEVDYFIEGSAANFDSIGYFLYMPMKITFNNAIFCEPVVPMVEGVLGSEQSVGIHRMNFFNSQLTVDQWEGQGYYYFGSQTQSDSVYIDPFFLTSLLVSEDADVVASILTSNSTKLGFSSDMYHDEHVRQGHIPTYFRKDIFSGDSLYDPQMIITPILSFNVYDYGVCYIGGLDESEQTTVSIHPNPAVNKLTISSSEPIKSISIFDLLGNKIVEFQGENQLEQYISVEGLRSGCYLIEVIHESGKRKSARFVTE